MFSKSPRSSTHGSEHSRLSSVLLCHNDYTVGWICALSCEMTAAQAMFDHVHPSLENPPQDKNIYSFGSISGHNVVVTCLPAGVYGLTSATTVATRMVTTFEAISIPLMIGIGGGVPGHGIQLGDIVVSVPSPDCPAIVQHDYGKYIDGSLQRKGALNKPTMQLLAAVSKLRADHDAGPPRFPSIMAKVLENKTLVQRGYGYPESKQAGAAKSRHLPQVYYGSIASGNQVIKDNVSRDKIAGSLPILAFETEAAGLMDDYPCLVVRGICDFCDGQKEKSFQKYAALAAAAYTKELLSVLPVVKRNHFPVPFFEEPILNRPRPLSHDLIEKLSFRGDGHRQAVTKDAHPSTCLWVFEHHAYREWLDDQLIAGHHGFLWIKSKPGAGKSTMMKSILEPHAAESISFFFDASGPELARSAVGVYRSLLRQLIQMYPELCEQVDWSSLETQTDFSLDALAQVFSNFITRLGARQVLCFIDALDEGPEDEMRDLVNVLESLGRLSAAGKLNFRVCCSSRHHLQITLSASSPLEINLSEEAGHRQDMLKYINSEFKTGKGKQIETLKSDIISRSGGIFLWTVLAVRILKVDIDKGRHHLLQQKLQDIPCQLGELFRNILFRDRGNLQDFVLCMQWVIYARQPLRIEELYFALLSANPEIELDEWDPEEISIEVMEKYITDVSKGLVELARSPRPVAQLIHDSVKDFLLHDRKVQDFWDGFKDMLEGPGHNQLRICCQRYIMVDKAEYLQFDESLFEASNRKAGLLCELLNKHYPFIHYAVRNVTYHAAKAAKQGLKQDHDDASLEHWLTLDEGFLEGESYCHLLEAFMLFLSEQSFQDDSEQRLDEEDVARFSSKCEKKLNERDQFTMLCMAAAHGLMSVIDQCLASERIPQKQLQYLTFIAPSDTRKKLLAKSTESEKSLTSNLPAKTDEPWLRKDQASIASFVASLEPQQSLSMIRALNSDIDHTYDARAAFFEACTRSTRRFSRWCEAFDVDTHFINGETPLHMSVKAHPKILIAILDTGVNVNSVDGQGWRPLHTAAVYGRATAVELLLAAGADVNAQISTNITYSSWRTERSECIVRAPPTNRYTPLEFAIQNGHAQVVEILLKHGARIDNGGADQELLARSLVRAYGNTSTGQGDISYSHTTPIPPTLGPLHVAAYLGYDAIVTMLLQHGADLTLPNHCPEWMDQLKYQEMKTMLERLAREGQVSISLHNNN